MAIPPTMRSVKSLFRWIRRHPYLCLLVVVLVSFLYIHGAFLEYPPEDDIWRDYLVAHTIVIRHQFPLVGPLVGIFNNPFGILKNSPLYFYLLAAPLLVRDSMLTLGAFGIAIQLANIVLLFLIGGTLWSQTAGIVMALTYAVNTNVFHEAFYPWQPLMAEPLYLTVILLWARLKHPTPTRIALLGATVIVATAVHVSSILLLPLFIDALWLAYRQNNRFPPSVWAGILCVWGVLGVLLLYPLIPVLHQVAYSTITPTAFSFPKFLASLQLQFTDFTVTVYAATTPIRRMFLWVITILTGTVLFAGTKRHKIFRLSLLVITLNFVLLALFAAISTNSSPSSYIVQTDPIHRLTPAYLLLFILIGGLAQYIKKCLRGAWIVFAIVCVVALASPFSLPKDAEALLRPFRPRLYVVPDKVRAVTREISSIIRSGTYKQPDFFQAYSYGTAKSPNWGTAMLWVTLEQKYHRSFVRIDDTAAGNFSPDNGDDVIFIICNAAGTADDETTYCLLPFLKGKENAYMLPPKRIYQYGNRSILRLDKIQPRSAGN